MYYVQASIEVMISYLRRPICAFDICHIQQRDQRLASSTFNYNHDNLDVLQVTLLRVNNSNITFSWHHIYGKSYPVIPEAA